MPPLTRWMAVAFCALCVGCGGSTAASAPVDTLLRYANALEAGDAVTAYALSSTETRERLTLDAFATLMRENREELLAEARSLKARASEAMRARAELPLENGEATTLLLEDGAWHIEGGALDAPSLRTPRDAVVAFRQALVRRDLRGVMRILNRQRRAQVTAEIARVVDATSDEADLQIEVEGEHARVHLTGGGELVLVRESGEWHVLDVE